MLLPGGLTCIGSPQAGHGGDACELGKALAGEATGTGISFALIGTALGSSFASGCSIRFNLLQGSGCSLSRETHPTVKRCRPFFAAGARLYTHFVGDLLYNIAEAYLFLFDEAG